MVFDNWDVLDFDINEVIKRVGRTAAGMDFGFTHDPTTFPRLAVDLESKELWIYAEHHEHGMLRSDILALIKGANMMQSTIIADSAEPRLIAELQADGVRRIQASVKGKNSVMAGIQFMQEFRIHIHASCEHTAEEFATYAYQQDRDGRWLNKPIDANNHHIDAIRYALEPYHLQTTEEQPDFNQKLAGLKKLGL